MSASHLIGMSARSYCNCISCIRTVSLWPVMVKEIKKDARPAPRQSPVYCHQSTLYSSNERIGNSVNKTMIWRCVLRQSDKFRYCFLTPHSLWSSNSLPAVWSKAGHCMVPTIFIFLKKGSAWSHWSTPVCDFSLLWWTVLILLTLYGGPAAAVR